MVTANNRISSGMKIPDVVGVLSDGNPGALQVILDMLHSYHTAYFDLMFLDSRGIYGVKIYQLWKNYCGRNMRKLETTLQDFRDAELSHDEIYELINNPCAHAIA